MDLRLHLQHRSWVKVWAEVWEQSPLLHSMCLAGEMAVCMDGWKHSWMSCLEYVWPAEQKNLAHLILKELKKTKNNNGYLWPCHRANFQSNWSSSCQETVWNTCRIREIMLRVNEILTLLRSSVYYPCYVSPTVSTWTCSVCSLSYLVAHLMTHPVKIWSDRVNWTEKLSYEVAWSDTLWWIVHFV